VRHVLVVNAECTVCAIVVKTLSDQRTKVICAFTGISGAEELVSQKYDLALIDVRLPDLSGFLLAELAAYEDIPVLLMASHRDSIERVLHFGFSVLKQPLDRQVLITEATGAMAHRQQNIQCVIEAVTHMRASVQSLGDATLASHQLAEASLQLINSAMEQRAAQG
jgi:DNA-binding response OmpR family regulator